ncbi:MFS transporter [bacterium]|nr:MFS transporter [bacterium]
MSMVDVIIWSVMIGASLAFIYIVWSYVKGLKKSPRDMWILFATKIVEYTAYGAMNMTFILWLSSDCGLGDVEAGLFITAWGIGLSLVAMVAGALVDAIGIKKTLMISIVMLIFSRFFMFWITNPILVMILGFIPLALGFAIVGPVVSVAIKKYTTKEGATLGFGLFYVLMNVAFAIGGWLFDAIRDKYRFKDPISGIITENVKVKLSFLPIELSTYQIILFIGFALTFITLILVSFLREGVEVDDEGNVTIIPPEKKEGTAIEVLLKTAKEAFIKTGGILKNVVTERTFWIFIFMISLLIPVRLIFYHFHYTFPKYGIRVLGEGAKIGSIYGVLNPVLIIFFVPLVAALTKKVSSYKMMTIGTFISSFAVFIAVIPGHFFASLENTWLGEIIFVRWLGLAPDMGTLAQTPPNPAYFPLIFFIVIFTIGEAIWSPRLMQFTVEVAPKGKEGTYLALSVLPFFVAKLFVGPLSGWLVKAYTPLVDRVDAAGNIMKDNAGKVMQVAGDMSNHHMVWIWVGGIAIVSPLGLLFLKKLFDHHEEPKKSEATE